MVGFLLAWVDVHLCCPEDIEDGDRVTFRRQERVAIGRSNLTPRQEVLQARSEVADQAIDVAGFRIRNLEWIGLPWKTRSGHPKLLLLCQSNLVMQC